MPLSLTAISMKPPMSASRVTSDAPALVAFAERVDSFRGVLEHVGQRLGDQAAVEVGHDRRLRQPLLEIDVGAAHPHEEHRLTHAVGEVVARRPRLRHAGERGELVDHALDVVDLADDRVGALVENVLALDDVAAVAALEPLGGKLDRRQRILDLVGDAPGDVGPGGGALRRDEVADVVERDDAAGRRRVPGCR